MAKGKIKLSVDIVKGNTSGISEIKRELASLNNQVSDNLLKVDGTQAKAELQEVQRTINIVDEALSKSFNVKLDSINVAKFRQELEQNNVTMKKAQAQFTSLGDQGERAFKDITLQVLTANKHIKQQHQLLDKMADTLANTVRWSIASSALNAVTGSIQKAWSFTKKLDTSLNDIRIVTGKSADEMARFAKQANTAAKNLGATTKNYTDAALIYYQQGLSEEDVQARTSTTLKAANVTGQSTDEVSQQLTAVWNGYKVSAQEAEIYIDKLSAVAATTAADLEELSTGMSKVASAANVMGVDIDQLNAQLATIVSVTRQAPESIGTALKTVFARMTDIEAGVDTETTLGEYTARMAEMGVNVLDANGQLREMGEVVEEIGNNWNKLTREQQVSLAQTIAGTRQYNNMMALFDNWDMYQQAKSTSENSAGSLQKQQEIYLDSLEAHLNKLTTEAEELYQTLMDPEGLSPLIDALTKIVDLVENMVEGLGGGAGVLGVAAGIGSTLLRGKATSAIAKTWHNMDVEKANRKLADNEAALINDINTEGLSEDQATELIKLKQTQLRVSGALTKEEIEAQEAQIKQTAEIWRQNKALKDQKELMADIGDQQFGDKDLFDEQGLLKNQDAFVDNISSRLSELKGARTSQNTVDEYTRLQRNLDYRTRQAAGATKTAEKAKQSTANLEQYADTYATEADSTMWNNELTEARKKETAALEAQAHATEELGKKKAELETVIQRESDSIIEQKLYIEELLKSNTLSEEQATRMAGVLEDLNQLYDENGELKEQDGKHLKEAIETQQKYNAILDEQIDNLTQAAQAAKGYNKSKRENIQNTKDASKALAEEQARLEKMSTVDIFANMTAGIANLAGAINSLQNLGSIWSNEDLTTGEKMLQTITNLAFALPMLISGIKMARSGLSDLLDKIGAYEGAANKSAKTTEKKTKAIKDETKASKENNEVKKETAKVDIQGSAASSASAAATKKEATETENDTRAGVINVATEKAVQQANRETALSSLEKAGATKIEANTTDEDSLTNIIKGKWDIFKGKMGKAKTGVGKFVKAHPKAIGAVGATLIAATGTAIALSYVNNIQKNAMEEATAAAEQAANSFSATQQALDKLNSSVEKLATMQSSLEGLTEGTIEWKQAIAEINAEVLALLEKFPELQVSVNGQGVMTATNLEEIQAKQLDAVNRSQANKILANKEQRQASLEYLKDEWADSATYGSEAGEFWANAGAILAAAGTGAATGAGIGAIPGMIIGAAAGLAVGAGSIIAQEIAEKANKKTVTETDDFKKFAEAYAIHGSAMLESDDALKRALEGVGGELNETTLALYRNKEATEKLIAAYNKDKAMEYADRLALGKAALGEEASVAAQLVAGAKIDRATDDADEVKRGIKEIDALYAENEDEKAAEDLAKQLGWEYDKITGEGANKVQIWKDGQSTEYTIKEIYEMLWRQKVINETGLAEAEFEASVKSLNDKFASDAINNILPEAVKGAGPSGADFTKLTLGEMSQLTKSALTTNDVKGLAQGYGISTQEFLDNYKASVEIKDQALIDATKDLTGIAKTSFDNLDIDKTSLTLDTYKSFIKSYSDIAVAGGQDMLNEYDDVLKAAGGKSDEFINALAATDWSSIADPSEHARTIAENLGLELTPELEAKLGTIVNVLADHVETLDKLQEKYASWQNLIDKTVAGTIWSAEEYDKLEKSQQKYFTTMADGTHVLIGNARELRDELRKAQSDQGYRDALAAIGVQNKLTNEIAEAKGKGEDTTALEFELEQAEAKTLDAFVQYAKTADNEQALDKIWNDERFKNVQGKTDALREEVLQAIDIQNLADTLGTPIEEVAALWSKFAGNKGSIVDYYTKLTVVTRELENQKRIVQELEDSIKFLGSDTARLENLKKQSKALTEQARLEQELLDIELEGIAKDVQNNSLTTADLEKVGIAQAEYDAFINSMVNNGTFDEAFYQKLKEAALRGGVEDFDLMDEYLTQYSDKLIEGTDTVNQSLYAALDKNAESFDFTFTMKLDAQQTKREFVEFYKNFDSTQGVQVELFNFKSYQEDLSILSSELNKLYQTETAITEEQWEQMSAEEKIDAIAEGRVSASEKERLIKEKTSQIMDTITSQQEGQINAIEEMNKLYDEQVSYLETASGLIDKQLKTQELLTGKESKDIKLLQQQRDIDKSIYESRKKQFADIKAQYDALDPNNRSADADEIRKAYFEAANGIADAMNSALESNASYIEEYAKSMMEGVFGLSRDDIEMAQEEQDWIDKDANKYLDSINKAYELDKMRRTFDKAINESTNISAQQRLAEIYNKQVKALEKKGELTKEDFERVNKMLELEQARLDLENVRDSKTQMRLMRGADGTYGYQYIADQSKINEAEQKVADLENELYNMDKNALKESSTYFAEQWMAALDMIATYAKGGFSGDEKGNLLNVFRVLAKDKEQAKAMMGNWLETNGLNLEKALGFSDEKWAERGFSKKMVSFFKSMTQGDMNEFLKTIEDGTEEELQAFLTNLGFVKNEDGSWSMNLDYAGITTDAQQEAASLNNPLLEGSTALSELGKLAGDNASHFDEQTTAILRTCAALSGLSDLISGEGLDVSKLTGDMATLVDTVAKTIAPSSIDYAIAETGGYTGAWGSEGKFLLAHEKELILNKYDTANILSAVDIVRSLGDSMLKTVSGMGRGYDLSMAAWELAKDFVIEQTVHINAEFPNVTDRSEIEAAFDELILLATQHAFEDVRGR